MQTGVTRTEANAVVALLSQHGIKAAFLQGDRAGASPGGPRRAARRSGLVVALALLTVGACGALVAMLLGRDAPPSDASATQVGNGEVYNAETIAALATPATVSILCGNQVGTGFYVSTTTLLTNDHVLCDSPPTVVLPDGRHIQGHVETRSARLDAARVRTERVDVTPLRLGDVTTLVPGVDVFSIGAAGGLASTLTRGMVSHPNRPLRGLSYIQVDQAINHGNSGGPLLTAQGLVVGIVTLRQENADGVGFALPVNYLYPTILGTRPSGWNEEEWTARAAAAAEPDAPVGERAPTAANSQPMLLAAGSLRAVLPPGWDAPEQAAIEVYALLAMTTTSVPPSRTEMNLYSRNQRLCTFVGTPEWRSAVTLADAAKLDLQTRIPVPLTQVFIGLVPLRPESPCMGWRGQAQLRMNNAEPGFEALTIAR